MTNKENLVNMNMYMYTVNDYIYPLTLPVSMYSSAPEFPHDNLSIRISRKVIACFDQLFQHTRVFVPSIHHGRTSFIVFDVDVNARLNQKCPYAAVISISIPSNNM